MMSGEEHSCKPAYLAENPTLGFACWKPVVWDAFQGRKQHLTQSKLIGVKKKPDKKKLNVILRKKDSQNTK